MNTRASAYPYHRPCTCETGGWEAVCVRRHGPLDQVGLHEAAVFQVGGCETFKTVAENESWNKLREVMTNNACELSDGRGTRR
jgi:hypothetical protein